MKELLKAKELIVSRQGDDIDLAHAIVCIDLALKKLGWIPVEDRLPEDGWRLLLYTDAPDEYGKERIGVYLGDAYWTLMGGYYYKLRKVNVTHWMPLPSPPDKEE